MAAPKKNKDGLLGGKLVSQKDYFKVIALKKKKEREDALKEPAVKPEE